jgi:hypothetical protein
MLNLKPHRRIHIPNSVALLAVLLLLVSTAADIQSGPGEIASGQQSGISTNADSTRSSQVINAAEKKTRGINLGLLLFRRG